MFAQYDASPNKLQLFCVSWDRLNAQNLGSKMFGIFETPAHYFRVIQRMPAGTVCGYEIILEGTPCKLYLDVEWETHGAEDMAARDTVHAICAAVTANCKKRLRTTTTPTSTAITHTTTIPTTTTIDVNTKTDHCLCTKKAEATEALVRKRESDAVWQDLELDFYVSTCSRMKNQSIFKNSFHIVVNNVIFPNNHDGMMKDFVMQLTRDGFFFSP